MRASPPINVCGASANSADRSSARVLARSCDSGQAANGETVACAPNCAPAACGLVSCALVAMAANGPRAVALACHGRAAPSTEFARTCPSSANGGSAAMRALPLAVARSLRNVSDGTRCSRPASWPSSMRAAMSRSGDALSYCSSPMRRSPSANANGSRSDFGSTASEGVAVVAPICTRSTRAPSMTRPIHAPSCGRQAQCASRQASLSSTMVRAPVRTSTRCALNGPPNRRPVGCAAMTIGARANSHVLPVAVPYSHDSAAVTMMSTQTSTASVATSQQANLRRGCRVALEGVIAMPPPHHALPARCSC